jgi:hypothetical protein
MPSALRNVKPAPEKTPVVWNTVTVGEGYGLDG